MDVQYVLFLLFWLLPGFVLGVSSTLFIQYLCGGRRVAPKEPKKLSVDGGAKKTDGDGKKADHVEADISQVFLSNTGRVHKRPFCSGMKQSQAAHLCAKCFKIA